MRMIPVLEKANPRIYPMPLVVRLLDPFSFSVAPDFFANLSETNRIQNNALGVFFTVSANEIGYLSKNRSVSVLDFSFFLSFFLFLIFLL